MNITEKEILEMAYSETTYEGLKFAGTEYSLRKFTGDQTDEKLKFIISFSEESYKSDFFNTKDAYGHTRTENICVDISKVNKTTPDNCEFYELKDGKLNKHVFSEYKEIDGNYKDAEDIGLLPEYQRENAPRVKIPQFEYRVEPLDEKDKQQLEKEIGTSPTATVNPSPDPSTDYSNQEPFRLPEENRKEFLKNVEEAKLAREQDLSQIQREDKKIAESHEI